jgi:hypothetical protein
MDGWIELYNCPHCRGLTKPYKKTFSAPYLQADFCGGILPLATPVGYVECILCGLVIQSPRMTDERIAEYYTSGAYRATLGMSEEAMDFDERRRAQNVCAWLDMKPESHADIGASRGFLLDLIGAPVQKGYDINPKYARAREVSDDRADLIQYELVTAVHVLEHVTDPLADLEWYKSLTAHLLYIEVPGLKAAGGPLRFAHLYYFPPSWLVARVEEVGLKIIRTETDPNTRILCGKIPLIE